MGNEPAGLAFEAWGFSLVIGRWDLGFPRRKLGPLTSVLSPLAGRGGKESSTLHLTRICGEFISAPGTRQFFRSMDDLGEDPKTAIASVGHNLLLGNAS